MNMLLEITVDIFYNVGYFLRKNINTFASAINVLIPYLMYFVGQGVVLQGNEIHIGGEIVIPLLSAVVVYYLRTIANKIGKGITVPLPERRFTEVDDDGEVSIENNRIQELLLYVADLEDWLEKKGML